MRQVLHILKKDIYSFRIEIVVVLLSALVSVWAGLVVGGVQQPMFSRVLLWVTGLLITHKFWPRGNRARCR
jgi:ABC-type microcin C transport system permease subunit YejE